MRIIQIIYASSYGEVCSIERGNITTGFLCIPCGKMAGNETVTSPCVTVQRF